MPCGSSARVEEPRMMVASSSSASHGLMGASGGPQHHHSRFHVAHVSLQDCHSQQQLLREEAAAERRDASQKTPAQDSQCEQLHMAVGILDSLPWCRAQLPSAATATAAAAAALRAIPELAAPGGAAAAARTGGQPGLGDAADSFTLTAQVAKSISQLRVSASSSNFPSVDGRCCNGGPACDCGVWETSDGEQQQQQQHQQQPPQPPPLLPDDGFAERDSSGEAASHLEPPWSQASCCRSGSHARPASPASLRQLAAAHRCERLGPDGPARSASFRRAAQQQPQQPHQLPGDAGCGELPEAEDAQLTYQEYLDQLHERVHLWLLTAAEHELPEGAEELGEGGGSGGFCCGSPDCSGGGADTVTAATAAAYCHGNRNC